MEKNASEFVRLLITGSRNMDRIKADICAVMALTRHAIRNIGNRMDPGSKVEFNDEFGNFGWYFKAELGPKPRTTEIMIRCVVNPFGSTRSKISVYSSNPSAPDNPTISTLFACDLYEQLPLFIARLLKEFPGLEQELDPFLHAARADLYQ